MLLDVDGTLIHDRGYRHALVMATQYICGQRGLPTHAPTDHEINVLHSCGYSNEWDSVPFTVGINLLLAHHDLANGTRPDFAVWAQKTKDFIGLPNERARDALLREAPIHLHADIRALLDDVRNPHTSITTRMLYNFVLGSALFESHYAMPAAVQTPSLLEEMDVPLIDARGREIILSHRASIYTARPSLPPEGKAGLYQTPEAEIALKQLRLESVPLIGLGPMQWLVDQFDGGMWEYAKPAPVQPLAAMLAASGMSVKEAALAAYQFVTSGASEPMRQLDGATALVFEDNAGGVRAARDAAALLAQVGVTVQVIGYGIAQDDAKRTALAQVCDQVFDDVNVALTRFAAG